MDKSNVLHVRTQVGFIDSGTVLAEDNPLKLIQKLNCQSLEDVFLHLCIVKSTQPVMSKSQAIAEHVHYEPPEDQNNNDMEMRDKNDDPSVTTNGEVPANKDSALVAVNIVQPGLKNGLNKMRVHSNEDLIETNSSWNRMKALLKRHWVIFKRNPTSMVLLNIIPVLQTFFFCITFAHNPTNIPVAIVNHDSQANNSLSNVSTSILSECTNF